MSWCLSDLGALTTRALPSPTLLSPLTGSSDQHTLTLHIWDLRLIFFYQKYKSSTSTQVSLSHSCTQVTMSICGLVSFVFQQTTHMGGASSVSIFLKHTNLIVLYSPSLPEIDIVRCFRFLHYDSF